MRSLVLTGGEPMLDKLRKLPKGRQVWQWREPREQVPSPTGLAPTE